ncbi:heavy-metal-associated domain-containing protein [Streptococcus sp. E17BB]|uniref:heavy-metal-associated domain-containing protein n=1 Tax=Streptococcus sp. E17BB TaxID=3278714 RepID=UPI00359E7371
MEKTYPISGLKCQGCVNTVTEKLLALKTVDAVQVNLEDKQITVTGTAWKMTLNRALKGTKFRID